MKYIPFTKAVVATLASTALLFSGCINKQKDIEQFAANQQLLPLNVQYNVLYQYSDSAQKRLEITAPEVLDFSHSDDPYMEFPQGITVDFFNKLGQPESNLKANYAKRLISSKTWEARGDVIVYNNKGERLNTEHLTWNQPEHRIYSNVFTKITSGDEVLMGDGFEADENFTEYVLKGNVKGQINIEEKQDSNTVANENAENS